MALFENMTSMERVLTALGHKEPDRVPLMLLLATYGANELQLPVKEYFSNADHIVEAQLRMLKKYRNDCIYTFTYASIEHEAWGGEVIYRDYAAPNAGSPIINDITTFLKMNNPIISESTCLKKVLDATIKLKAAVKDETPIIGVVMSPFSLPVMQMGFEKYLNLIYFQPDLFEKLMQKNIEFCVAWANAQLKAGATAICYFDPLASPTIIDRDTYLKTGYKVANNTLPLINGPTATHLASGITLPVLDDIISTGSAIVGFSTHDSLEEIKQRTTGKISLLGNLNGIEMVDWSKEKAEQEVKKIIASTGKNGGLLISDNHGEIPLQVPEDVLMAISESVMKWGKYPLDWMGE